MTTPNDKEQAYILQVDKTSKEEPQLAEADWDNKFIRQRNIQRTVLFCFALGMSLFSFIFLVVLVFLQAYLKIHINQDYKIISDTGIQIISVSIFGHIFGVVYIIAKALWSNHEFNLMKK